MERSDLWRARVPRYTSYPPIPHWRKEPDSLTIQRAMERVRAPAEVYVHVPFCKSQCSYCGCNMVVAQRRAVGPTYLDALRQQVSGLPLPATRIGVQRIHLGGGTPTWFQPAELAELMDILRLRFEPVEGAELSIEAAPHVTRIDHLSTLAELGFNRVSFGIQSFDSAVLGHVGRPMSGAHVAELVQAARSLGFTGVNLDLMRGLPGQNIDRFRGTLGRALDLGPDRLAVFGYAHLPHLKSHQARFDASLLPDSAARRAMAELALEFITERGYQAIGLDHFAKVDDLLAVAARAGELHRNFMGYVTGGDADLIGLGMSAISEVGGVCWQDEPKLGPWFKKVRDAEVPAIRSWVLTDEDLLRRDVIHTLLCNHWVEIDVVSARHGVEATSHFSEELRGLAPFIEAGFAHLDGLRLSVPERLPEALRPVAAVFDAYLEGGDRYSLAI